MPLLIRRWLTLRLPETPLDHLAFLAAVARFSMRECQADERVRARLGEACTPGGFNLKQPDDVQVRTFAVLAESNERPIVASLEEIVTSWAAWLNLVDPWSARIAIKFQRWCGHVWIVRRDWSRFDPAVDAGMPRPTDDFYQAPDAIVALDEPSAILAANMGATA